MWAIMVVRQLRLPRDSRSSMVSLLSLPKQREAALAPAAGRDFRPLQGLFLLLRAVSFFFSFFLFFNGMLINFIV